MKHPVYILVYIVYIYKYVYIIKNVSLMHNGVIECILKPPLFCVASVGQVEKKRKKKRKKKETEKNKYI